MYMEQKQRQVFQTFLNDLVATLKALCGPAPLAMGLCGTGAGV